MWQIIETKKILQLLKKLKNSSLFGIIFVLMYKYIFGYGETKFGLSESDNLRFDNCFNPYVLCIYV